MAIMTASAGEQQVERVGRDSNPAGRGLLFASGLVSRHRFTGCGKTRRERKTGPQALRRGRTVNDFTARVELVPFPLLENSDSFRKLFSDAVIEPKSDARLGAEYQNFTFSALCIAGEDAPSAPEVSFPRPVTETRSR
jgi:hypothetical protein